MIPRSQSHAKTASGESAKRSNCDADDIVGSAPFLGFDFAVSDELSLPFLAIGEKTTYSFLNIIQNIEPNIWQAKRLQG
jgi:hypothetical protein